MSCVVITCCCDCGSSTWDRSQHGLAITLVSVLPCRWQHTSTATDVPEVQEDAQPMDLLKFKAVVAALMFSTEDDGVTADGGESFVPRVQDYMEARGEFGMAEDIADGVELAKSVRKVTALSWCLCLVALFWLRGVPSPQSVVPAEVYTGFSGVQ